MRKTYGIVMVALHRDSSTLREGDGIGTFRCRVACAGRAYSVGRPGARLQDRNFVVVTTEFPTGESRPHKVMYAGVFS